MVNCKCWSRITYSTSDPILASKFFYKIKDLGFQAEFFSEDNRVEAKGPCLIEGLVDVVSSFKTMSMIIEGKCWGKTFVIDKPRVLSISGDVFLLAVPFKRGIKFFVIDSDKISPDNTRLNIIGNSIDASRSLLLLFGDKILRGISLVEELFYNIKKNRLELRG